MAHFFGGFGWNFQGLLAMVNLEFHFFIFGRKKFSFQLFMFYIFSRFLYNKYNFFLLLFCCCPAELESVEIFEISLSVLQLCQNIFFHFSKIILNLTLSKKLFFFTKMCSRQDKLDLFFDSESWDTDLFCFKNRA